jgi:prepilin-type N-terminal cleavage/methylation domain-containing protein
MNKKGFTLLEILLVVAAISILAGIVILAINPNKQLGDTRNAQRSADTNTILNAIYQYALDNNGTLPTGIGVTAQVLGTGSACDGTCGAKPSTPAACLDISGDLVPTYVTAIPNDPQGTAANTDYYVVTDANNRVEVGACDPESGKTIRVTR